MTLSKKDLKKLWAESGNQCAFPDCEEQLVDFDYDSVLGEMSHIHARNSGGPRYDEKMHEDERESYSNRILLCRNHHKLVDDAPDQFPPELLQEWKETHQQQSPDPPELPPELLDRLFEELDPSYLLVDVENSDVECLRDVLEWEPSKEYPEKVEYGHYPIVVTLDDLKQLHDRLQAPYRTKINGEPMYKRTSDWSEDELIQASAAAARITQTAIQYYQIESNRRKSQVHNEL